MKHRAVTSFIVIHHSATPGHMDIGAAEIETWHKARGWESIGYNLVIRRYGTIEPGRPLDAVGSHTLGYNQTSVGICLIGLGEDFTPAQWDALDDTISFLERLYPGAAVVGHRDLRPTECPGFDVKAWLLQMDTA